MATAPAKIYSKTSPAPTKKTLIFYPRAGVSYPFEATNWLDLRVGWWASLCKPSPDDDVITGLAENSGAQLIDPANAYWMGVKNRGEVLPNTAGQTFIGYSNYNQSRGNTKLASSDKGVGTSDTNYWRATSTIAEVSAAYAIDGTSVRAIFGANSWKHYAQANIGTTGPAGYATLFAIRLTRPTGTSNTITAQIYQDATNHTGDSLYSSTPTKASLTTQLETFTTQVSQVGPITLSIVPDAFFFYWPFLLSRLRIHALGEVQVR